MKNNMKQPLKTRAFIYHTESFSRFKNIKQAKKSQQTLKHHKTQRLLPISLIILTRKKKKASTNQTSKKQQSKPKTIAQTNIKTHHTHATF